MWYGGENDKSVSREIRETRGMEVESEECVSQNGEFEGKNVV